MQFSWFETRKSRGAQPGHFAASQARIREQDFIGSEASLHLILYLLVHCTPLFHAHILWQGQLGTGYTSTVMMSRASLHDSYSSTNS